MLVSLPSLKDLIDILKNCVEIETCRKIDYLTICSPNNLHDAHIRLALRVGANAICEKPLVLNPWNLDALQELESESSARVFTILQLRVTSSTYRA